MIVELTSPLGLVPTGWRLARLSDVTSKIGSGATPLGGEASYLKKRSNYALVRSQNVFDRRFDAQNVAFITDQDAHRLSNVELQHYDVLLNITGDGITFARACMVDPSILPARVNQHVAIIRAKKEVLDPGYLLSYLTHPQIKLYMESFNSGGSRRALTKGHIESFLIPLPPLPEQRAIAQILETLDKKIELNRQINETLEKVARTLFKLWFIDFEPVYARIEGRQSSSIDANTAVLFPDAFEESAYGPIPQGWRIITLDDVIEFAVGGDWGKDIYSVEYDEPAFCIRGADIPDLQKSGLGKMPTRYLKSASIQKRSLQNGDLVIEVSGGSPTQSTGRSVLITEGLLQQLDYKLVCSNFCRMIRLNESVPSTFIYLWLRWLYDSDIFLQYENGTTGIKNFAFTAFSKQHALVLPSSDILKEFNSRVDLIFKQQQIGGAQSRTLATIRDELLPKLVSGELSIRDAEGWINNRTAVLSDTTVEDQEDI